MAKQYRPIAIPKGVELSQAGDVVTVKGKLGTLQVNVKEGLVVKVEDSGIHVEAARGGSRAQVGTLRALIRNAVSGVTGGFEKVLQVRGMGYRAQKTKEGVQVQCGFSHLVDIAAPKGITFEVNAMPNPDDTKQQMFEILVKGIDRHDVGLVAARIRAIKTADPYKGKGIRYRDEFIRKKAGKRAVGAQT
ncbi:MAG: 50S ribosomal protein L6 [candidate division WOR-3 bacterium]|nr:MAG: 50S ribosomal protein L6 [candidate division WOR-3 bacterium]